MPIYSFMGDFFGYGLIVTLYEYLDMIIGSFPFKMEI